MHLLALSAFRLEGPQRTRDYTTVSMHLLVLSAFRRAAGTFRRCARGVSMHLLVLSAFRRRGEAHERSAQTGLNAPFGAQCFPTGSNQRRARVLRSQCTFWCSVLSDWKRNVPCTFLLMVSMHLLVLSAFRHRPVPKHLHSKRVSMHLLVLSAFRRDGRLLKPSGRPVSMHLLVLSAFRR